MSQPPPADASEGLEQWAQKLQQQAQRYDRLQEQLNTTSTTERSAGGEITVTVDANGVLTDLELSEAVRGMEPGSLSAKIMRCMHSAQAKLREQVTELVYDTVGDDSPGNNIVQQYQQRFPDPPEEGREDGIGDAGPAEHDIGKLDEDHDAGQQEPPRPARRLRDDEPDDDEYFGGSVLG